VGRPQRFHLQEPNSVLVDPHVGERVRVGLLALEGLCVAEHDPAWAAEAERLGETLRAAYGAVDIAQVPGVAEARSLVQALGLDGTRTPPASEALLASVLQGRALPRGNTFQDALQLAVLRTRLLVAAFDADRLGEQVLVRMGAAGEAYPGARGRVAAEGRPVLSDREGAFGGLLGDAPRTRVGTATTRVLVALFVPPEVGRTAVEARLDGLRDALVKGCGGQERARYVV
jgi:DNA/RNA-binding domain of Phe-tRNA-synthetase-like protein